jgi:hypothetical protein
MQDDSFFRGIMGKFSDWIRRRNESFGNKYGMDNDKAGDYENDLKNLAKLLVSTYHTEFFTFLQQLVEDEGNSELQELMDKVAHERKSAFRDGDLRNKEPDEVVAPMADRGSGEVQ